MNREEKEKISQEIKDALKKNDYATVKLSDIPQSYSKDMGSMLFILLINICTLFVLVYFVS